MEEPKLQGAAEVLALLDNMKKELKSTKYKHGSHIAGNAPRPYYSSSDTGGETQGYS